MAKNNLIRILVSLVSIVIVWAVMSNILNHQPQDQISRGLVLPIGWSTIIATDSQLTGAPYPVKVNEGYPFAYLRPSTRGIGIGEFNNIAQFGNRYLSLFSAILIVATGNGLYLFFRRKHD